MPHNEVLKVSVVLSRALFSFQRQSIAMFLAFQVSRSELDEYSFQAVRGFYTFGHVNVISNTLKIIKYFGTELYNLGKTISIAVYGTFFIPNQSI